jgi:peroxiredoxin Q/BCP
VGMKRQRAVRGVLLALIAVFATVGAAGALEVGQKAPDFTLTAPDGKPVKLGDLLAKGPLVIYTFIQAFTGT